ncbi:MAG: FAD-binding protein [Verrucomicrobiales bacterium]|nr:FAD-binding protein [Verrucomicrobiales bacterium]
MLEPGNTSELQDLVIDCPRVLPVGGRTKSRLCAVDEGCQLITTRGLSGIMEYQPSEYTFTAFAGTPVREIQEALRAKGQFLPCSALCSDQGATLGGAVASGLSGAGRFRFGGLRDFVLGIRFLSGEGMFISAGGKVVKNAAGFDLPKFMVGSLGRYGILTEMTFKVFPRPSAERTLQVQCQSHEQAVDRLAHAASSRWELYAIDYEAVHKRLYLRVGTPSEAIAKIASDIIGAWPGDVQEVDDVYWQESRELSWVPDEGGLVKVPVTPGGLVLLQNELESLGDVSVRYSSGGNVAYVAVPEGALLSSVSDRLTKLSTSGLLIVGGATEPLWLGAKRPSQIAARLKQALDPCRRFPTIQN